MPLSDHEQRLLEQIERALVAEDPKFASTVRSTDLKTHQRRRVRRAVAGFILGFGLLFAGVISKQWIIGVVGFVVMLGSALYGLTAAKRPARSDRGARGGGKPAKPAHPKVMDKFEERWRRRRGDDDRPF